VTIIDPNATSRRARTSNDPYDAARARDGGHVHGLSPLQAARHYWYVTVLIAAVGLFGGVGFSMTQPTVYTAEVRGAVGGQDIKAQSVPGFALASQQVASNYARYITASQFGPQLKAALGDRALDLVGVAGSPIPESNLVRIMTAAKSPSVAMTAADTIATALKGEVNGNSTQDALTKSLQDYQTLSQQVADAQSRQDSAKAALSAAISSAAAGKTSADAVKTAQTEYKAAVAALAPLQLQQQVAATQYQSLATSGPAATDLVIIGTAQVTGSDKSARAERYGLAGLVVGFVIALAVTRRMSRRRAQRMDYQPRRGAAAEAGRR
jgi:hypothetical protein